MLRDRLMLAVQDTGDAVDAMGVASVTTDRYQVELLNGHAHHDLRSRPVIAAANSEGFKEMIDNKFFELDVRTGEEADKTAAKLEVITVDTFNKFADQIGAPVKSAADLGLPAPSEFESWWPPEGYTPPPTKG